jgi:ribosome-associated translation inhibitor RaiA
MSSCCQGGPAAALAERRSPAWRAAFDRIINRIRSRIARHKQRRELRDYLASDYRAAADIGYYDQDLWR